MREEGNYERGRFYNKILYICIYIFQPTHYKCMTFTPVKNIKRTKMDYFAFSKQFEIMFFFSIKVC